MAEIKLNTLIKNNHKLKFGDFILFQEYEQGKYDGEQSDLTMLDGLILIVL